MAGNPHAVAPSANGQAEAPASCDHNGSMTPVVRTLSNGSQHYGWQCLTCGCWLAARRDQRSQLSVSQLGVFDEAIRKQYEQRRAEKWATYRAARHTAYQLQQTADNRVWWSTYRQRLERQDWEQKRQAVLRRDEGLCQARLPHCRTVANQAHHLSYKHFGNEPLFELIAVCTVCHEQITGMDRDE